jgi:hypothetical protein
LKRQHIREAEKKDKGNTKERRNTQEELYLGKKHRSSDGSVGFFFSVLLFQD